MLRLGVPTGVNGLCSKKKEKKKDRVVYCDFNTVYFSFSIGIHLKIFCCYAVFNKCQHSSFVSSLSVHLQGLVSSDGIGLSTKGSKMLSFLICDKLIDPGKQLVI